MKKLVARSPNLVALIEFNCARCRQARATLEEIHSIFPLRHIERGSSGKVAETTPDAILREPKIDWLLVLSKGTVR